MAGVQATLAGLLGAFCLATPAWAESIGLPSCEDRPGEESVLLESYPNAMRLFAWVDANQKEAIVLADCANSYALQVRDAKNWFDGNDIQPGVPIYDRRGQVSEFLNEAVQSEKTYRWADLRRSLAAKGYQVRTGSFSAKHCACDVSWDAAN